MDKTTHTNKKTISYSQTNKDYPIFVYATNKQVDNRNYIIRTCEPRFIAEANIFNSEAEADLYSNSDDRLKVKVSIKYKIIVVTVLEFWDSPENYDTKVIQAVTKRLAHWYKSQLISHYNYKRQSGF